MAGSSFKPNKRGLDQFHKELQRELNKRPVRVRVEGDPRSAGGGSAALRVTYNGPVFQGDVHGAQLAWANSGDVTQRMVTKSISPNYEPRRGGHRPAAQDRRVGALPRRTVKTQPHTQTTCSMK